MYFTSPRRVHRFLGGLAVVMGLLGPAPQRLAAQQLVPEVHADLSASGSVRVFVNLEDPTLPSDTRDAACARIHAGQERFLGGLPAGTCSVRYRYRYSPVVLLEVTDPAALAFLDGAPQVRQVALDARGSGALAESRSVIRADRVAAELGLTGRGRVVGLVDSGVDASHPDLAGAVIHQYFFLNEGDSGDDPDQVGDRNGHGTHVAGIIASRGRVAEPGIAPETDLVSIRVLDNRNSGWISDWAAAVEYLVDLHREDNGISIDAINMSLASHTQYEGICDGERLAFSSACQVARDEGIAVIAASGNSGSPTRMSLPGCYSSTISVGSVRDESPDEISTFTSRNDQLDVLAPGEDITSSARGGGTTTMKGTSQATPHVSGIVALAREAAPDITPHELLVLLRDTGQAVQDARSGLSFPRVDALAALEPIVGAPDCNANGAIDFFDIVLSDTVIDCDFNGVPDTCDLRANPTLDCDASGALDVCEIGAGLLADADSDGIPDLCEARPLFYRGDSNGDGSMDISDARWLFDYLFVGGRRPTCREASDANNDGFIDIADGITILLALFHGKATIPPPGPPDGSCGEDTDEPDSFGDSGCESYTRCPPGGVTRPPVVDAPTENDEPRITQPAGGAGQMAR